MKENVVQVKSYGFAIRVVELYKRLIYEKKEFALSKQILKSGTSIGSNIEEAIGAQSKKDFIAKLSIAYKETRETNYWIKLLRDTQFIDTKEALLLQTECEEIIKIITKILKTMKEKKTVPQIINS
jgi:four helix bundle protein